MPSRRNLSSYFTRSSTYIHPPFHSLILPSVFSLFLQPRNRRLFQSGNFLPGLRPGHANIITSPLFAIRVFSPRKNADSPGGTGMMNNCPCRRCLSSVTWDIMQYPRCNVTRALSLRVKDERRDSFACATKREYEGIKKYIKLLNRNLSRNSRSNQELGEK